MRREGDSGAAPKPTITWRCGAAAVHITVSDKDNATTARVNANKTKWTQINDIWTATHPGGDAYQSNKMSYFKSTPPAVYRYQK